MTILVTGSTGTIGTEVVARLAGQGVAVRALTRSPDAARLPDGVVPVRGDLADLDALRAALSGVDTLFLLSPVVPDELTWTLIALGLAQEAGVRGLVYLSVFKGEEYADVPHFTGKHAAERMIAQRDLPATVLRPAYYMQNDLQQKDALLGGVYAMPLGRRGISMVDTRDIAEAAAAELLRRDRAATRLPREVLDLVGPDPLTGTTVSAIWSEALRRPVAHAGDDLDAFERTMKAFAPGWLAYDMRQMMHRYQQDGAVGTPEALARLTAVLGHPPRSYRDFAAETAGQWQVG